MKLLFFTVLCFSFVQTKSQVVQILSDSMPVAGKLNYNLYEKSKLMGKVNGGMVYTLPQDNMPAFRPDTSVAYNMPVHSFKKLPYRLLPFQPQQQGGANKSSTHNWKDIVIQTPYGPKKISIPHKNNNSKQ